MPKPANVSADAVAPKWGWKLLWRRGLRAAGKQAFPVLHRRWGASWRLLPSRYSAANSSDAGISAQPPPALQQALKEPHIIVFWHEALIAGFYLFSPKCRLEHPACATAQTPASTLISPSDDGAVLAKSLQGLGLHVHSGSSRLGGRAALAELCASLKAGDCQRLLMTPDGPLGPAQQAKLGALIAAQKAGVKIIPVGIGFRSGRRIGSWDKMWLPAFKGELQLVFGLPIDVPSSVSDAELGLGAIDLSTLLSELTGLAQQYADAQPSD